MIPVIRSITPHPNPTFNKYRVTFTCGHTFVRDYTVSPLPDDGVEGFPVSITVGASPHLPLGASKDRLCPRCLEAAETSATSS